MSSGATDFNRPLFDTRKQRFYEEAGVDNFNIV